MSDVVATPQMVSLAINTALPTIHEMQETKIAKRFHGHITVSTIDEWGGDATRLGSYSLGVRGNWLHPYKEIAENKEGISLRTGLTTREVHEDYPELIVEGDVPWKGTAVNKKYKIVVAFSGVDEYIDEAIAEIVLAIIVGLIREEEAKQAAAED